MRRMQKHSTAPTVNHCPPSHRPLRNQDNSTEVVNKEQPRPGPPQHGRPNSSSSSGGHPSNSSNRGHPSNNKGCLPLLPMRRVPEAGVECWSLMTYDSYLIPPRSSSPRYLLDQVVMVVVVVVVPMGSNTWVITCYGGVLLGEGRGDNNHSHRAR